MLPDVEIRRKTERESPTSAADSIAPSNQTIHRMIFSGDENSYSSRTIEPSSRIPRPPCEHPYRPATFRRPDGRAPTRRSVRERIDTLRRRSQNSRRAPMDRFRNRRTIRQKARGPPRSRPGRIDSRIHLALGGSKSDGPVIVLVLTKPDHRLPCRIIATLRKSRLKGRIRVTLITGQIDWLAISGRRDNFERGGLNLDRTFPLASFRLLPFSEIGTRDAYSIKVNELPRGLFERIIFDDFRPASHRVV